YAHSFCPKVMWEILGMKHNSCRFLESSVRSLNYTILLRCNGS
ncbi:hypothetical protein A2U01_0111184, partial [Trifolium medium]|nr:hypothetical protein [Trifolium medium]